MHTALTSPALFQPIGVQQSADFQAHLSRLFQVEEHTGPRRHEVESFVSERFAEMHGAQISHFMPRLLSLRSKRGDLIAAFGLRAAESSALFLENYLSQPVETILQARLNHSVERRQIIEVGHLSALYPGAARWLIVAVTALLQQEGYRWVTFTGTAGLRNGFHRLGLRPVELGAATLAHLPEGERAAWGRYYDHAPKVMAGDIAHGYHALASRQDLPELLRGGLAPVECDA
jgi:hypothetical protein